jgi:hypothetical protein
MKRRTKISLASLGLLATGAGLTFLSARSNWDGETNALLAQIKRPVVSKRPKTVSFKDFEMLPAPVAAYFRRVLKEGQPITRTALIRHNGEFQLNGKRIPFSSQQNFSTTPPAFVWKANIKMNPFMNVSVRDAYSGGKGSMKAKIWSLFSVADARDRPELAAGALQRYWRNRSGCRPRWFRTKT